jgi:hypothetical protein
MVDHVINHYMSQEEIWAATLPQEGTDSQTEGEHPVKY